VLDHHNVCYLTDYWTVLSGLPGTEVLLCVPPQKPPWLAVPGLETLTARAISPGISDVRYLRGGETSVSGQKLRVQTSRILVAEALASLKSGTVIGIDMSPVRRDRFEAVAELLSRYRVVDTTPVLLSMRSSKDADELQRIREGSLIACEAAAAIYYAVGPGVTEQQLASEAARVIWSRGATVTHLVVGSGPRAALPHAMPTSRAVASGDYVVIDIGVLWRNYWAEIARTYIAGQPSSGQADLISLVQEAQLAARSKLIAGVPCCTIDHAARTVLSRAGFDDGIFTHSTGHGLGVMGPDGPSIAATNTGLVPQSSTLTLEPGLYFPGRGGIRIEDSFYVGEHATECLTQDYYEMVGQRRPE
jgi:Xaa-Pro aminopeptidase